MPLITPPLPKFGVVPSLARQKFVGATNQIPASVVGGGGGATTGGGGTTDPGGHWDIPDYASLIAADPNYQKTLANIRAAGEFAASQRRDAIRRAVIQAGFSPTGWKSGYGDLDAASLKLAASNPNSTLAGINLKNSQGNADLQAALGARGLISSGALTGGSNLLQRNYEQAQYGAGQTLADSLYGYEGTYAQAMQQLEYEQLQAAENAAAAAGAMYQPRWIDNPAPPDTTGGDTGGGTQPKPKPGSSSPFQPGPAPRGPTASGAPNMFVAPIRRKVLAPPPLNPALRAVRTQRSYY